MRSLTASAFFAIALLFTSNAVAQPSLPDEGSECGASLQAIERDIEIAHSKGQMLRRGRLEEALANARASCGQKAPDLTLRERIEAQERTVAQFKERLERAEEELRRLRDRAQ